MKLLILVITILLIMTNCSKIENLTQTDNSSSANTGDNIITLECDGNSTNSSSLQFSPEKGASVWKMVKNKNDCGYALVGGKDKRPWVRIVDENGNSQISKTYDEFGDYKSSFLEWPACRRST